MLALSATQRTPLSAPGCAGVPGRIYMCEIRGAAAGGVAA